MILRTDRECLGRAAASERQNHPWTRSRGSVHGSFAASVLVRGAGAILALAVNVVLARMLGVAEYGRYMTQLSAALILGSLAVRGSDQLLTRELSAGGAKHTGWRHELRHWAIRRVAVGIVLAVVAYFIWIFIARTAASGWDRWSTVLAGALLIMLFPLCTLTAGALNGFGASLRSQTLALVLQNIAILVLLGVMWLLFDGLRSGGTALWLQAGGYTLALLVGWRWLHASVRGNGTTAQVGDISPQVATGTSSKRWSSASRHFLLVAVAALLVNRLDVILVSSLAGNATAGIYVAGARLAQVALMVAMAVNTVLSPRISEAWARKDFAAARRMLRGGLMFTIPVAVVEVAAAFFFARHIVALLGSAYAKSAMPFAWVTMAYALFTLAAPYYAYLGMTGSEKSLASISWMVLIANVSAIFLLLPLYGATGAGMAMGVGYALALLASATVMWRKMRSYKRIAGQ